MKNIRRLICSNTGICSNIGKKGEMYRRKEWNRIKKKEHLFEEMEESQIPRSMTIIVALFDTIHHVHKKFKILHSVA